MAADATPRALLLDCLGTLLRLEPPAPLLRDALGVPLAAAERAVSAEIAYYRAHLHEATSPQALEDLRDRCAAVTASELGLDPAVVRPALLDSLRFTPYDDVPGALRGLRERGVRLVVVSNWDVSLHDVLERTGLRALVDGAVASAEVGAAKPDPRPVRRALELAGVAPREAWLAGDSVEADVGAARAAGVRPVLVDRDRRGGAPAGVLAVSSLASLVG